MRARWTKLVNFVKKIRANRNDFLRLHQICSTYGMRPSDVIYTRKVSPMIALAIDNEIWEIGVEFERQMQLETIKAQMQSGVDRNTDLLRGMGQLFNK